MEGGIKDFLFFPLVPNVSHQVPKGFSNSQSVQRCDPQNILNNTWFYLIWFPQGSTLMYIN